MRRLAFTLALAILGLVAGALTAHALDAQGPYTGGRWTPQTRADSLRERATFDSMLVATAGCVVRRADDPAGWTTADGRPVSPATATVPPLTLHLDSAGIRVTEAWASPGVRDDGTVRWCPRRDVTLTLSRARFLHTLGDPPFGQWRDSLDTGSMWRVGRPESVWPDSGLVDSLWRRAGAFATWRGALAVLAPRFHDAAPLPPVVTAPPATNGPTPAPPVGQEPQVEPCVGSPTALLIDTTAARPLAVRRDDVFLVAGGRCVAIVTLASATRWSVQWPPCEGVGVLPDGSARPWRVHRTTYTTRSAAVTRARSVPACPAPAARTPDARNLPTPLPFTRTTRGHA